VSVFILLSIFFFLNMDPTGILFRTTRGDILSTRMNYKELDNLELEALTHSIRDAKTSLEAELQRHQSSTTAVLPDLFKDYGNKLDATVQIIKHLGRLENRQARLVESAASILKTGPTTSSARVYREFLIDVTRLCGRGLALLCAASLGKNKVATLTTQMRASFVGYVQSRKEFLNTPILDTLAAQYELPSNNSMFPGSSAHPMADYMANNSRGYGGTIRKTPACRRLSNDGRAPGG
jgi:hypothetical protein